MITLRCTKKLQRHLGVTPDPEDREPSAALGDWYGNLVNMRAELPLILLTNERSLLCLVLPHDADPLATLGRRAAALLRRLGLPEHAIEREAFQLRQVRVGKTNNRRVLGSMNDAVLLIEASLFDESRREPATLEQCEDALARNLYSMLEYRHPVEVASGLLEAPPQPQERERVRSPAPEAAASQRVPVRLSPRDRELIVEHGVSKRTWVRDPDSGGVRIPNDVKVRTTAKIERYAEKHFKGKYSRIDVRFRGQFCYIDAYREPGPHVYVPKGMTRAEVIEQQLKTPTQLCRLRYFGKEDSWSMGFFKYSDEKYELCRFQSGEFFGTPEEAFEIAAGVYLQD